MTTVSPTGQDQLVADLATTVRGPVLQPGDPGFDEEIAGFNLAHRPAVAVAVGATCAADVVAAVRYAAATGRTQVSSAV